MDPKLLELSEIMLEAGGMALAERSQMQVEVKPDGSFVTSADRKVETFLREKLPQLVDAPMWGEEFGFAPPSQNGLWTMDPIDGTTNYSLGSPLWGVGVALVSDNHVNLASIYLPVLNELYIGGHELGAWMNNHQLKKVEARKLQAQDPVSYDLSTIKLLPRVIGKARYSGAAVVDAAFVAAGRFKGIVGGREHLYDVAPGWGLLVELGFDLRHVDRSNLTVGDWRVNERIVKPWCALPPDSGLLD